MYVHMYSRLDKTRSELSQLAYPDSDAFTLSTSVIPRDGQIDTILKLAGGSSSGQKR
jgi:hypothetical protein